MYVFKKITFLSIFILLIVQNLSAQSPFSVDSLRAKHPHTKPIVDRWIAPDKGLHLLGSMMVTVAGTKTLQEDFNLSKQSGLKWAMGFTFSLGIGKELWDSTKPHNIFSWKDLTADIVGIFLGRCILEIP